MCHGLFVLNLPGRGGNRSRYILNKVDSEITERTETEGTIYSSKMKGPTFRNLLPTGNEFGLNEAALLIPHLYECAGYFFCAFSPGAIFVCILIFRGFISPRRGRHSNRKAISNLSVGSANSPLISLFLRHARLHSGHA